jgi:hypothetical protein
MFRRIGNWCGWRGKRRRSRPRTHRGGGFPGHTPLLPMHLRRDFQAQSANGWMNNGRPSAKALELPDGARLCPQDQSQRVDGWKRLKNYTARVFWWPCASTCGWSSTQPRSGKAPEARQIFRTSIHKMKKPRQGRHRRKVSSASAGLKCLALGFYKDGAPPALRNIPKGLQPNRNAVAAFSPALP